MAEGGVDIEMDERGKEEERVEGEEDTGETSFTDGDQRRRLDDLTGRPILGSDDMTRVTDRDIPNAGRDAGAIKRSITEDKKRIFKEEKELGFTVNVGDGPASKELIEQTEFIIEGKDVVGATFKGKRVMVRKIGGGIRRSGDQRVDRYVEDFDKLIEEANAEHSKTLTGAVEEVNNDPTTPQEVVDDIRLRTNSAINDRVEERVENLREKAEEIAIPKQEVREFAGTLHPKGTDEVQIETLESLEGQINLYRLKALREADPAKEQFYKSAREAAELKADSIRIRIGERPKYEEAMSILSDEVENNDLNRLEKFKRWAKENMVGLSAIAITIAGIITTIVVAARKAVSGGARAVGGFAKALANLGKKLGPLLAPLFSVVAQVLTWGAKGIAWLANNLWVLAIAMTWLLYDYWKNRKIKPVM